MLDDELAEIVAGLRARGADDADIEAKRAADKLPRSIRATLSAFANTRGGVVVLGIDEAAHFEAVGVTNAAKFSSDLADLCSEDMEPPLRPVIRTHRFENVDLVVAEVPMLDPVRRPCFYRGAGITQGSFVRVGDSDRRLSSYEVHLMLSNRGQPHDDEERVDSASMGDLNPGQVESFVARLRHRRPHAFGDLDTETVLRRSKVLAGDRPTLAGLLALGDYPQEIFPQLMVRFVHYPTSDGPDVISGERFVDSMAAEGPIPVIAEETLIALRRNMRRRSVVRGPGRTDIWEYPQAALREAVINALAHRDYSPQARGTQVQVEMYPDRLVIRSPGGLFGNVTAERPGEDGITSTRNATLLKLLEDVTIPGTDRTVCENRGSGIQTMVKALGQAGLSPPEFTDAIASFRVTFGGPTDAEEAPLAPTQPTPLRADRRSELLRALADDERTRAELAEITGLPDKTVARWLATLRKEGTVEQVGDVLRSPRTRYRRRPSTK